MASIWSSQRDCRQPIPLRRRLMRTVQQVDHGSPSSVSLDIWRRVWVEMKGFVLLA